jgi:hypothetical protein
MAEKVEFYRENVLINDNVMECCRIYKVGMRRLSMRRNGMLEMGRWSRRRRPDAVSICG